MKGEMNMMRGTLATVILFMLSNMSAQQLYALQCPDRNLLSADQKLQVLEKGIDRSDRTAVKCAIDFMEDLSHAQDSRAIGIIVQYLDLRVPETPDEVSLSQIGRRPQLYGGEYPAMDDLGWYPAKLVIPVLISTIAQSIPGSMMSGNAIRVFMAAEAPDPPGGVRRLMREAVKAHGNAAAFLTEAARNAASTSQCRHKLQACQEALKTVP